MIMIYISLLHIFYIILVLEPRYFLDINAYLIKSRNDTIIS